MQLAPVFELRFGYYKKLTFMFIIFWQAIVMMLEDGHERVMLLMKDLFQFFSKTNIITPDQIRNVSVCCLY